MDIMMLHVLNCTLFFNVTFLILSIVIKLLKPIKSPKLTKLPKPAKPSSPEEICNEDGGNGSGDVGKQGVACCVAGLHHSH